MASGEPCWLCQRPLGRKVERHHPIPKARGGRETVPVHPICHRTLHKTLDNKALEAIGHDVGDLRREPAIARFLAWIANKPPGFHAPTHGKSKR
ncbi:HNH endonuclease [Sphingomicrobium clamense]|uniref:HNH endonuclease n=1 Tax=Sphingomicrobium clamense TaxID=2851013 RepID=A0ABS6V3V5_9SPHN|nr:HNH endonuclease [Sphingomicrobium sp. B8]